MNSIEALEAEIRNQTSNVSKFRLRNSPKRCLFVGAGDSYAAGLAAQRAFASKAMCCNPLDFVDDPSIGEGRTVYIISISGRTVANIRAAKVARNKGFSTVAITTSPESPLARSCSEIIQLKYEKAPVTTAGTASFLASMIACLSLAGSVKIPKDVDRLLELAERQADELAHRMRGITGAVIILAEATLLPIAICGCLKLNEVLGLKAFAYSIEEFCHSPLFSIGQGDGIIILGHGRDRGRALAMRLAAEGLLCSHLAISGTGVVEPILHSTFIVQMFALKMAQQRQLQECYFLSNKTLLRVSSDFIYG